jgi:hypothetical protein
MYFFEKYIYYNNKGQLMQNPIPENKAHEIFDILVELNATNENERANFVDYFTGKYGEVFHEYRISGKLNPGGKFKYWGKENLYVDYYSEADSADKRNLKQLIDEKLKTVKW